MKRSIQAFMLIAALAIPSAALAQAWRAEPTTLTPFGGFMLNGEAVFTAGTFLSVPVGDRLFFDSDVGIASLETWLYADSGLLYEFVLRDYPRITPFIAGGVGVQYFSEDRFGNRASTDLKLNAGGGVKFFITTRTRLRLDLRVLFLEGTYERLTVGVEIVL